MNQPQQAPIDNCKLCGNAPQACTCYASPVATWSDVLAAPEEMASPGEIIRDKYQVIRSLGSGATATVFLVRHMTTDELFAMKMLNRDLPNIVEASKRFELEATAISKLQHRNMVAIYDFGMSNDGHPFFITDFVQGKSLFNALKESGRLEPKRACGIFLQICDAMDYAHKAGMIHRDLKSTNILLVNDQEKNEVDLVRIVDFGIVKFIQIPPQPKNQRLTQDGTVVGSPTYMSPEQCQGHELDNRSDIYSLGCLMYEVLTGKVPFDAGYPFAILMKQVTELAPRMSEMCPDIEIDPKLEEIVLKTLSKKKEDRYQSMSELQDALKPFAE